MINRLLNFWLCFRALAINEIAAARVALSTATNAAPITDGEWVQLAPYGEIDYWTEEGGRWKKYRQQFTREQGTAMQSAFNAERTKRGTDWRGLNIFIGHPDADPKRWPDDKRLGGIMDMETRADGLWVKPAWNAKGKENITEGYYVYPSPAWLYNQTEAGRTGIIKPDELRSVGLTNTPRIADVKPWTNSDPQPTPDDGNNSVYKPKLLKLLGLADSATDEQINTALETHGGQHTAACSDRDQARRDSEKYRGLAINATLDDAVAKTLLTAAERPAFEIRLKNDFDATAAEIKAKTPALNSEALVLKSRGMDTSTPAARAVAFNAMLDGYIRPVAEGGKGMGMETALAAMRATAEGAALLKLMESTHDAK